VSKTQHYVTHWGSSVEERVDGVIRSVRKKLGLVEPLKIIAFRGFGDGDNLWLCGRVLEDQGEDEPDVEEGRLENMVRMLRRYASRETPGAIVEATYRDHSFRVEADEEGYFAVDFAVPEADQEGVSDRWRDIELELQAPLSKGQDKFRTTGRVLVPPEHAEYVVVSDIDDTIVQTGATNLARHVRTVLLNSAHSRTAFPGVPAFYRALELGSRDRPTNPIFYVSSSPWNLYPLFESFMELKGIPAGPIFLKDFGLAPGKLFKTGHGSHKVAWIERLMDAYPELPFVLLGDSGQKDAEIYREIVEERPGRVKAVYLRDVSDDHRDAAVRKLIEEMKAEGIEVVFDKDTRAAAENAVEIGLIDPACLEEIDENVEQEVKEEEEEGLVEKVLSA
jgi:phosphatidate phosphatase APP1